MDFNDFLRWEETNYDTIKVKRIYVDIADDIVAGVLLSQIVYWYLPSRSGHPKLRVMKDGHLWLAKGREDWFEECRVSPWQFDRASDGLVRIGVLEKQRFRFNGSPTVHVRLIPEVLMERVESLTESRGVTKLEFSETLKSNLAKHENPIEQNTKNITETTTEITTQTTLLSSPSSRRTPSEPYTKAFEGFWNVYPRKHGKKAAFGKWQARLKDQANPVTAETLTQAAKHYAEVCRVGTTTSTYILHPETFLGPNLRYADYINPECVEVAKRGAKAGRRRNDPDDGAYRSGDDDDFWDKLGRT